MSHVSQRCTSPGRLPLTTPAVFSYLGQQQPGKAITFLLKLRRPGVVELVQRNNLFTDIQDKIADLIAYDRHLEKRQGKQVERQSDKPDGPQTVEDGTHGAAIQLLVDNTHSVPVRRMRSAISRG